MDAAAVIADIAQELREPAWMTQRRRAALARHHALPWPHKSDDIWRRTDVSLLDPARGFAPVRPRLLQSVTLSPAQADTWIRPLGDERLAVRANGHWLTRRDLPAGVVVDSLAQSGGDTQAAVQTALAADGLTDAEQKLATLNDAFHHDDVVVRVPAGMVIAQPLRIVHLASVQAGQALFPMTVVTAGAGASVTLIDEYASLEPPAGATHLVHGRVELRLEPGAQLHYVRLQRWGARAREFYLQRAILAARATLTLANLNLGASLSKAHLITTFAGEGASSRLYGFVFGRGSQHIDQHTLQDHQAPRTTSDLQFKAALQDESRAVYTGLIRIAKTAQHTEAFQASHSLFLGQRARSESIPMLEILADDVQCKHGASAGPIDEEMVFYLMSRGCPRETAQRLVVMGFVEPIVQQVPFEPLREQLRAELEGSLHG